MTTNDHIAVKRTKKITVRFTPEQFEIIRNLASTEKKSNSDTVRSFCFEAILSRLAGVNHVS